MNHQEENERTRSIGEKNEGGNNRKKRKLAKRREK